MHTGDTHRLSIVLPSLNKTHTYARTRTHTHTQWGTSPPPAPQHTVVQYVVCFHKKKPSSTLLLCRTGGFLSLRWGILALAHPFAEAGVSTEFPLPATSLLRLQHHHPSLDLLHVLRQHQEQLLHLQIPPPHTHIWRKNKRITSAPIRSICQQHANSASLSLSLSFIPVLRGIFLFSLASLDVLVLVLVLVYV